jgi:L-aminopeptidase/D-esterase-like protein
MANNPAEGRIGAGAGATVGKLLGPANGMPGGLGRASVHVAGYHLLGIAVVNALGDVYDGSGRIIAGARAPDGTFADVTRLLRESPDQLPQWASRTPPPPGTNTTLAVVATDAPLGRLALTAMARMAAAALARRISPVNTPFDGDIVFALSTAQEERSLEPAELLGLGAAAAFALEQAIERAVRNVR